MTNARTPGALGVNLTGGIDSGTSALSQMKSKYNSFSDKKQKIDTFRKDVKTTVDFIEDPSANHAFRLILPKLLEAIDEFPLGKIFTALHRPGFTLLIQALESLDRFEPLKAEMESLSEGGATLKKQLTAIEKSLNYDKKDLSQGRISYALVQMSRYNLSPAQAQEKADALHSDVCTTLKELETIIDSGIKLHQAVEDLAFEMRNIESTNIVDAALATQVKDYYRTIFRADFSLGKCRNLLPGGINKLRHHYHFLADWADQEPKFQTSLRSINF